MNAPIRIKTFQSRTVQEAYELIRKEFGPDASILETRVSKRGWLKGNRIEIVASSSQSSLQPSLDQEIQTKKEEIIAENDNSLDSPQPVTSDDAQDFVQASEGFENAKLKRICAQVFNELCDAGIERSIVEQWIEAAKVSCNPSVFESAWSLSAELASWVQDFVHVGTPIRLEHQKQQVIAFVGPAGAGKTTAIAKIASSILSETGLRVGVLDCDPRHVREPSFLTQLSELVDWKFVSVEQRAEGEVRNKFADCDVVLVDTYGYSPAETEALEELGQFLESMPTSSTYLLLPGTCNSNSFVRYYNAYSRLQPDGLILTKLDEVGGLGPLFACLQACPTPVSYLGSGRQVPSEMSLATPHRLARLIVHSA